MKVYLKNFVCVIALIAFVSVGVKAAGKTKKRNGSDTNICHLRIVQEQVRDHLEGTEGVEDANLNLSNKKIKVKYNPDKTSPDKIRAVISNTGYDADNVKKSAEGYKNLPHCCQKPE